MVGCDDADMEPDIAARSNDPTLAEPAPAKSAGFGAQGAIGATVGGIAGAVLGLIDAQAALAEMATRGSGGEGVTASILLSPVYFLFGMRNGFVVGAPVGAVSALLLGAASRAYIGQPGRLGRASTWHVARVVAAVVGFVGACIWEQRHPTELFSMWG
jgi:hypothetical protein